MNQKCNRRRVVLSRMFWILGLCSGMALLCGCGGDGGTDVTGGDSVSTPVNVSGTWTSITIIGGIEFVDGTMTLSQSGNTVSGSFDEGYNYGTIDGAISGNSITFHHVYTSHGLHSGSLYWGTVEGNVIRGRWRMDTYANYPPGVNELDWKAIRQ